MSDCWKPYVPSDDSPWNLDRAKHLHRRAGFGATYSELQRDVADGHEASVERMLNGQSRIDGLRDDFETISQVISDSATSSDDENRLKAWWIFRICFTPNPLQEKLALMWHNHFATSNLKVRNLTMMRNQNELFRVHSTANFSTLLHNILRDPAMLVWLDANTNRVGHPNENLARELMELFTLGIGNFNESDVRQAARALTGWSTKLGKSVFDPKWHDGDNKNILGESSNFDCDTLATLLLKQESTGQRLAWRLCDVFMGENVVSDQARKELADGLRNNDLSIRWAVETILRSDLFFSQRNIGSRISSPIEYIASTVRALELFQSPPSTLILAEWCTRLGQDLFNPPNVGGWNGGRNWLNSRSIIGRSNFASALVAGELKFPNVVPDLAVLASRYNDQTNHEQNNTAFFESILLSKQPAESLSKPSVESSQLVAQILSLPQASLT